MEGGTLRVGGCNKLQVERIELDRSVLFIVNILTGRDH